MPTIEKPTKDTRTLVTMSFDATKKYLESILGREYQEWSDAQNYAYDLPDHGFEVAIPFVVGRDSLKDKEFLALLKSEFDLKDGDEILFTDVA